MMRDKLNQKFYDCILYDRFTTDGRTSCCFSRDHLPGRSNKHNMKKCGSNQGYPDSNKRRTSNTDENMLLTVFCGYHDVEVSVPRQASSDEVASAIRNSLGVRGSFFLLLKTEDRRIVKSASLQSIYFHCSSIKASVLAKYKEFAWEIRGTRYQKGGDSLWYYQSQQIKPENLKKMQEDTWKPLDFPP